MLQKQVETLLPTEWGNFTIMAYAKDENDWMPHLVLIHEKTDFSQTIPVRFHSECLTGDVFHSTKCECGKQLQSSMNYIQENGGIVVYLRQEGRNIGIINKLKAYKLQSEGKDTVEANLALGLPADARSFEDAVIILQDLGIESIYLMTNNPEKIDALKNTSIVFKGRIPIEIKASKESKRYLETKKEYFKHLLELD